MEHLTVDCGTGDVTTVPLTSDELAQQAADAATAQAEEQTRLNAAASAETQHAQAVQTLMAAMPSDAARSALAFILGLPTP